MSALKKGIVGAIIGTVLFTALGFLQVTSINGGTILSLLLFIPIGALYGFGFAFGFAGGKRLLAKFCGVAGNISLIAILFSRDRGRSIWISLMVFMFAISFIIGLSYIPGIFIGIKRIVQERKAKKIAQTAYTEANYN